MELYGGTELPLCFMILIICCPQILLLFGVGFGGGDGKMFGCYSKLQTELDVLVFLG